MTAMAAKPLVHAFPIHWLSKQTALFKQTTHLTLLGDMAHKRQPHRPSKDHKERGKPLQLVSLTSISFSCAFFRRVVPRAASSLSLLFMSLLYASAVLWQECWYTLVCWREEEGKEEGRKEGGKNEDVASRIVLPNMGTFLSNV